MFVTIATAIIDMNEGDAVDSYWMAVSIYRLGQKMQDQIKIMVTWF